MDLQKLEAIGKYVLSFPIEKKTRSEEFAGVLLHSNSPFKLKDYLPPAHSFRAFSKHIYPIYFFISSDAKNEEFNEFLRIFEDVIVITIPKLDSIYRFNFFSINCLIFNIDPKHNKLVYLQSDGWCLKSGFEDEVKNYSWLGAKWKQPIQVIEKKFNFLPVMLGNGGCGLRLRNKCIEVYKFIESAGGQEKIVQGLRVGDEVKSKGSFLAEDAFFCYFGFGSGIFEPVGLDWIDKFAIEPVEYNLAVGDDIINKPFFFHRCDF